MGRKFRTGKEPDAKNNRGEKKGLIEGIDKQLRLERLFEDIRNAKLVVSIEDNPAYAFEILNKIKDLNQDADVVTVGTLQDAKRHVHLVDEDAVVLSDYFFPPCPGLGMNPIPLAREVYELMGDRAKAFAIITMSDSLEKGDRDLEWFRISKADFIGRERMEEMKKKKVIIAADDSIFTYGIVQRLRNEYLGYIFAAPGLDRSDYTPVEIIVLVSSMENRERELETIKREFGNIFGREFDEKLHKKTISSQELE